VGSGCVSVCIHVDIILDVYRLCIYLKPASSQRMSNGIGTHYPHIHSYKVCIDFTNKTDVFQILYEETEREKEKA